MDDNQDSASASPPPPPPPPPPGGGEFSDPFASVDPSASSGPSMDSGAPAVAAAPNRILLIGGIMLAFVVYMIFNLFIFSDDEEEYVDDSSVDIVSAEQAPDIQDMPDIAPPPPPEFIPPEIPTADIPVIEPQDDGPTNELRRQRIRSSMIISGGGGGLLPDVFGESEDEGFGEDGNLAFASAVTRSNTKAKKVKATHIGDLRRVVAEGKLIHGVLETAINTDLPGNIRAIVSRDTFPEAGRNAIIPKGSRLIGRYNSSVLGGQKRVYVIWTRVIRPDGVDVMLNSPLVDGIGQAGVAGQVDTKFTEIFSRAILTSVVTISVAAVADEINGNDATTTTTNSDGSTTNSGDATTSATIDASERMGGIAEAYLRRFINVQPTIMVDQGTPVNVFVNRDLIFPSEFAGTRVIP